MRILLPSGGGCPFPRGAGMADRGPRHRLGCSTRAAHAGRGLPLLLVEGCRHNDRPRHRQPCGSRGRQAMRPRRGDHPDRHPAFGGVQAAVRTSYGAREGGAFEPFDIDPDDRVHAGRRPRHDVVAALPSSWGRGHRRPRLRAAHLRGSPPGAGEANSRGAAIWVLATDVVAQRRLSRLAPQVTTARSRRASSLPPSRSVSQRMRRLRQADQAVGGRWRRTRVRRRNPAHLADLEPRMLTQRPLLSRASRSGPAATVREFTQLCDLIGQAGRPASCWNSLV